MNITIARMIAPTDNSVSMMPMIRIFKDFEFPSFIALHENTMAIIDKNIDIGGARKNPTNTMIMNIVYRDPLLVGPSKIVAIASDSSVTAANIKGMTIIIFAISWFPCVCMICLCHICPNSSI